MINVPQKIRNIVHIRSNLTDLNIFFISRFSSIFDNESFYLGISMRGTNGSEDIEYE